MGVRVQCWKLMEALAQVVLRFLLLYYTKAMEAQVHLLQRLSLSCPLALLISCFIVSILLGLSKLSNKYQGAGGV